MDSWHPSHRYGSRPAFSSIYELGKLGDDYAEVASDDRESKASAEGEDQEPSS
jgi:hypothetical protein